MHTRFAVAALAALLALTALPAGADSGASIQATAERSGSTATVTGTVSNLTGPDGPIDIGGTVTAFAAEHDATALVDLTGAEMELLDDGVRFTWFVRDLPDEVPPEGVRYTWAFAAGGQTYQLQAKRTNVASITTAEDPVGHALHAESGEEWFQLRGACEDQYRGLPTSGCYHLAFLDGEFDPANDAISIDLPFGARDEIGRVVAETFQSGVQLTPVETATMPIAASFQAVVSTADTSSSINGWSPVFTGPVVQLGVGNANGGSISYTADVPLGSDGTFSGTVTGFTNVRDTVYVRACWGLSADCTAPVKLG